MIQEADRLQATIDELEAWRARALPDASAPLDADDLARLVRACFEALGIDAGVGAGFTVNTVHYYRRKDILDEPAGRTSAARYGVRHLWQAVGARLAGHLGLVTLKEARETMRGADGPTLVAFVAARVLDARAQQRLRRGAITIAAVTPGRARPLPGVVATAVSPPRADAATSGVIPLPGEAWCIVPPSHPAHRSASSARELVVALAAALRVPMR